MHEKAPLANPHVALVVAIVLNAIPEGCVILNVVDAVHPFTSFIFNVYIPAVNPEKEADVCHAPPFKLYE